jgi:hypothetical protein
MDQCRRLHPGTDPKQKYKCICDKWFARWDHFLKHHKGVCVNKNRAGCDYAASGDRHFADFHSFKEFRKSECKLPGRPKKNREVPV